jgi:hypothetical protein
VQSPSRLSRRTIASAGVAAASVAGLPVSADGPTDLSHFRDGRLIILPSLKRNGGIHAIDTGRFRPETPVLVMADGYWQPDDGGGGAFRWEPENTEIEDGFIVFAPARTQGPGRWRRIVDPGNLSFEMAGAKGDGSSDDFVPCQQMLLIARHRFRQCRVVLRPGKAYLLDYSEDAIRRQATRDNQRGGCSLTIFDHCIVEGVGGALGITASGVADLSVSARLVLHPRMTVRLGYFAELRDLQILRKDMQEAVDHFSASGPSDLEDMQAQVDLWCSEDGTRPEVNGGVRSVAITNGGIDTKVRRVLVMGFHTAYWSNGFGRPVVDQLFFDTAGRGVEISRSADDGLIQDCFSNAFWSMSLKSARNGKGNSARRPGIAFDFHDKTDGLRCIDCTASGWTIGLRLSNVWAVTVSGLDVEPAEHPPQEVTRGIFLENSVSHTTIINPLIDGFTYKIDFQHRPLAYAPHTGPDNTPGLGQYGSASVNVIGGSIQGNPSDPPGHRAFRLGLHSSGAMIGMILAGFPAHAAILVEASVGIWKFVAIDPSLGEHLPLFEFSQKADSSKVLRFGCDPIDKKGVPQWTFTGQIVLQELPTSPEGLGPGSLWRKGSVLNIVD